MKKTVDSVIKKKILPQKPDFDNFTTSDVVKSKISKKIKLLLVGVLLVGIIVGSLGTAPVQAFVFGSANQITQWIKDNTIVRLRTETDSVRVGSAGVLLVNTGSSTVSVNNQLIAPILYGTSTASGNLTLYSTSHATKGKILFGTSAYDEVNNRLGIGTASPDVNLDVRGTIKFVANPGVLVFDAWGDLLLLGADVDKNTRTANFPKIARILAPTYAYGGANVDQMTLFYPFSNSTKNMVYFGGGTSQGIAATDIYFNTQTSLTAFAAGTNRLHIDKDGNIDIPADNKPIRFGAGQDADIYYDGTNLIINPKVVGTGFLSVLGDISLLDEDIILGTTTGTKIGTGATQKLGFYGATPVVQHSTTGQTAGFTQGVGDAVNSTSTFTGGVGATAYTIGDVVKALKNAGMMAQ